MTFINKKRYIKQERILERERDNRQGKDIGVNRSVKADLGYDGKDLLGKYMSIIFPEIFAHLAKKIAINNKASYLAFGAFNPSKTKKVKYKASIKLLKKARKMTKTPIVAIGGINSSNYKKLLLNKANFLAISGYIWNNKKYKPSEAIKRIK